jgi:K+-sensing histidine kinase KdpD
MSASGHFPDACRLQSLTALGEEPPLEFAFIAAHAKGADVYWVRFSRSVTNTSGNASVAGAESKRRAHNPPNPDADPLWELVSSPAAAYIASFVMTAVATLVAVGVDRQVTIPNLSLIFVIPVIIAAVGFGLGPSACSAILGALAYNFFLTEPRYSLTVDDPANIWAIALLFVVGLIVSSVAFTSRRWATEAALLRRQATVLQGYSRDVVAADTTEAIVSITSKALAALFQVPVVLMLVSEGKLISLKQVGDIEPQRAELEAARSSLATRTVVRAEVYPDLVSRFDFWPVATAVGSAAVIGLAFDPDERPAAPDELVNVVGNVLALVLERQHSVSGRNDSER